MHSILLEELSCAGKIMEHTLTQASENKLNGDSEIFLLKELVRRHKVCWEVWPELYLEPNGRRTQIGFELELSGIHYQPKHLLSPGCSECRKVYKALQEIAWWILPEEKRPSRYDIQIFDGALRYTRSRDFQPEVVLTIKILHRDGFDQPVNTCELRCLNEMEEKLRKLDASKGKWKCLSEHI